MEQRLHNGAYILQSILGQGGMSTVYLAAHTSFALPLALKKMPADKPLPAMGSAELNTRLGMQITDRRFTLLHADHLVPTSGGIHTDRFLYEALLLARLHHISLPMLYDYFLEDGCWYLVMDYIPGQTLSDYLRQHAPLPPLEALNYAIQLCRTLDYLHRQDPPVIFRDLKPSNIILTPNRVITLVDFGIACYLQAGLLNSTLDFGSPGYASPEQFQGDMPVDGRSDLFSLGVILCEMVYGTRSLQQEYSLPGPGVARSSLLAGLVARATHTDPTRRFQSAQDLLLAIEHVYAVERSQSITATLRG